MCDIHKGTRETERENYSSEIEIYEEKTVYSFWSLTTEFIYYF